MAKLSARGRHELARYSREKSRPATQNYDVCWERVTYAFMSDGHLLMKRDVKWLNGQRHTYNWTDKGKQDAGYREISQALESHGFTLVSGSLPALPEGTNA